MSDSPEINGEPAASRTVREESGPAAPRDKASAPTVRDSPAPQRDDAEPKATYSLPSFRDYPVLRTLSTAGGEADILVIADAAQREYVLRLYRHGKEPATDVFPKLVPVSQALGATIVNSYEAGFDEATGRHYEIQEYLPLGDLAGFLKGRTLAPAEFTALLSQLGSALARLHGQGLIHRDLKPDNILLRSRDPLQVAIADFGISSLLDPSLSVKETRALNTPLYGAPESFADFAGPAGDFWSLGVVLLEGLLGAHPLAGLSLNMVTRELSSRGLKIPASLPRDQALALQGLLTRDYRRRWAWPEIQGFLAGNMDIPVYYEREGENARPNAPGDFAKPFLFEGIKFFNPQTLAKYFCQSPECWEKGRTAMGKGLARDWLEANQRYDEAILLESLETRDPDELLFNFETLFGASKERHWRGMPLDFANLRRLATEGESLSPREKDILAEILNGDLARLAKLSASLREPLAPLIEALLSIAKPIPLEVFVSALAASQNPKDYLFGTPGPPGTAAEAARFAIQAATPLIPVKYLRDHFDEATIFPEDLFQGVLSSPARYREALPALNRMELMIQEAEGKSFFFRFREISLPQREEVYKVSPLKLHEFLSYFNFRLLDPLRLSFWERRDDKKILALENKKRLADIEPFEGIFHYLGNVLPAVLLSLLTIWLFFYYAKIGPTRLVRAVDMFIIRYWFTLIIAFAATTLFPLLPRGRAQIAGMYFFLLFYLQLVFFPLFTSSNFAEKTQNINRFFLYAMIVGGILLTRHSLKSYLRRRIFDSLPENQTHQRIPRDMRNL
ncbi:MAG: protein kinase [Deltaproteobacteria bacterium]|nr:protein kinase [Deltaproteobacteria bacterium]